jgi:hypothetical protein
MGNRILSRFFFQVEFAADIFSRAALELARSRTSIISGFVEYGKVMLISLAYAIRVPIGRKLFLTDRSR